ncbi:MAG: LrgB family protein [Verrucomicrobia bacterium]|nr:LrgB family protein [Verrucomicrobiota bacterium]MBV8276855.1 LrgB family protein [Verrucomicrobiota bacterium]
MNELLSTVLWSGITVAVFFGWRRIFVALKHPLLHPILWSTVAIVLLLTLTQHPVAGYRQETSPLVWLLGPAVVAMAVPIWQRRALIIANWKSLLLIVVVGIVFSAVSVLVLAPLLGWQEAKSLVPKSVTAPVALGIVKEVSLGRAPNDQLLESLLAVGIMISALSGAVLGPVVLHLTGVRDRRAVGLALGCASHGVGTARAFEIDSTAGAFASVGMSLTAILAGVILPWVLRLM